MKKENNQEFYVEQMDVHYPLQSEIQNEIEDIILKGMPQKISILKRIKKIYLGPGLRVIYYKNLSVFFATFIIYFAVCLGLVLFDELYCKPSSILYSCRIISGEYQLFIP